jgi:hypothetical protein
VWPVSYIDPGSGSMIVQLILGGAAAVGVGARFYWKRMREALRIRKPSEERAPR